MFKKVIISVQQICTLEVIQTLTMYTLGLYSGSLWRTIPNLVAYISMALLVFSIGYLGPRRAKQRDKKVRTYTLNSFKWCSETLIREGISTETLKDLVDEADVKVVMDS